MRGFRSPVCAALVVAFVLSSVLRRSAQVNGQRFRHGRVAIVIDGSPAPEPPGDDHPRRPRPGDGARHQAELRRCSVDGQLDEAVYAVTKPFGGLLQAAPNYGAEADREHRHLDHLRRRTTSTCRRAAGIRRRPSAGLPTSCAAIPISCARTITSVSCSTPTTTAAAASSSTPTRSARWPTTPWSTRAVRTRTGTRSGSRGPGASTAAGPSRWRSRSRRCATGPAPNQVWGCSCGARSATRTSGRISRRCRRTWPGRRRFNRVSSGGTLVGLDLPPASRNVELKPYAISRLTTDRLATPPRHQRFRS